MKRLITVSLLILTAVFIGCSSISYQAQYEETSILLEDSMNLNRQAEFIIDSLLVELYECQIQYQ